MASVPLLPSQLLESYERTAPPESLYAEEQAIAGPLASDHDEKTYSSEANGRPDADFATVANGIINRALGRTPGGSSVVEPDSVLGESGRLYHGYKEGKYFLPNDAAEQDRLDLQHKIFEILFDGWLALAPLTSQPRYALDIGTGTGLWATDFAEQNPDSFVIGTDLSAIQPDARVPNCIFVKDDAESPWYFPEPNPDHSLCSGPCEHFISFDYVHLRLMITCFDDTRVVMRNAYDNMNPGGWIEFQDSLFGAYQANPDFPGDALIRYGQACGRGVMAMGRNISKTERYEEWLKEIGFVDVSVRKFILPCGPWPAHPKLKQAGRFHMVNMNDNLEGIGWKMLTASGMAPQEIDQLLQECRTEMRNKQNHTYWSIWVVYGRKPFPNEVSTHTDTSSTNLEGQL